MTRTMTRMVPGWIVVAAVVSLGCSSNVLHGLDERTANDAVTTLERAGIAAEKVADDGAGAVAAGPGAGRYAVRVAAGDGVRALDSLRAAGLPREPRRGFAETYGQPSLLPAPSEERARYLAALSGEIERTLEAADGVVAARVHLVPEERDEGLSAVGDGKPRPPARAAVLLKVRPGAGENQDGPRAGLSEADVQKLVAGSVPGLEPAGVAVVVTTAAAPAVSAAGAGELVAVGPLRVAPGSRPLLMAAIAVGLAVLAALAGLLLMTARRLTAGARPVPPSAPRSAP